MKQIQQAPAAQREQTGAQWKYRCDKDNAFSENLPHRQGKVYRLLLDGVPRSAADITIALHLSDPRSAIRDLRKRGVPIADEWCESVYGGVSSGISSGKEVRNEKTYKQVCNHFGRRHNGV